MTGPLAGQVSLAGVMTGRLAGQVSSAGVVTGPLAGQVAGSDFDPRRRMRLPLLQGA